MSAKHSIGLVFVDDDSRRQNVYKRLVEKYNEQPELSLRIEPQFCVVGNYPRAQYVRAFQNRWRPSIIILDMVLENWLPEAQNEIWNLIEQSRAPIIAVSSKFHDGAATTRYLEVSRAVGKPVQILHWGAIEAVLEETYGEERHLALLLEHLDNLFRAELGMQGPVFSSEEHEVRLLHVTDAHFQAEADSRATQAHQISSALSAASADADMIIVSGDVTDRGNVDGYRQVEGWLSRVLHHGWLRGDIAQKLPNGCIACVPGNHDYASQLAVGAGSQVRWNGPAGCEFSTTSSREQVGLHWQYGLFPFAEFHRRIAGGDLRLGAYNSYRILNNFAVLGIYVVELWSDSFDIGGSGPMYSFEAFEHTLDALMSELKTVLPRNGTVVLTVHSFVPTDPNDQRSQSLAKCLAALGDGRRSIVLSGHRHVISVLPDPKRPSILAAEHSTMKAEVTRPDQLPCMGAITLRLEDGAVSSCLVRTLESRSTGWALAPESAIASWEQNQWVVRQQNGHRSK